MCLSLEMARPQDVLESGVLHGHEYRIISNGKGYLCGYVKVEAGHPWRGCRYDDIDVEVHGGVTFAEEDVPCEAEGPDTGYWVGFDCCHAGDAPDAKYVTNPKYGHDVSHYVRVMHFEGGTAKDVPYVRAECECLALQAMEAAKVGA
jgi:hypothetical protein